MTLSISAELGSETPHAAFMSVLVALVLTGAVSAGLGGARMGPAARRIVLGGALAMMVTYGIGEAVGTRIRGGSKRLACMSSRSANHAGVAVAPLRARLMSLLLRPTTPPLWLGIVVATSFIVIECLLLVTLKHMATGNAVGVVFLVGVLVVSTMWGFGLAATTSPTSAVAFDYFRNRPGQFMPADAENWVTIGVFLAVALVTNTVAYLARSRAVEADRRRLEAEASRDELRRLADLQAALRRGINASWLRSRCPRRRRSRQSLTSWPPTCACPTRLCCATSRTAPLSCSRPTIRARQRRCRSARDFRSRGPASRPWCSAPARATRIESHDELAGPAAKYIRELGFYSGAGAPILVDGRLWGSAVVGSLRPQTLPADTQERVRDFADLAATAIADAEARAELTASRARIVEAGDNAGADSNAIYTTALSSGSSRWDSNSAPPRLQCHRGCRRSGIKLQTS